MTARTLVVGVGNDLLRDDGFGIVALRRLAAEPLPPGVQLLEAGIAGIAVVQELVAGYDALVILDAADRGVSPGAVQLLSVEVPDPVTLRAEDRLALMADMHQAVPSLALILARALDVLPPRVFILGCQPGDTELGMELTHAVAAAVEEAVPRVLDLVRHLHDERTSVTTLTSVA